MVDSTAAANSLLKDGWKLLSTGEVSYPTGNAFRYLLGRLPKAPLEESKRIAVELKPEAPLRHSLQWDNEGEPRKTKKMSRLLGRLISQLKSGMEIRIAGGENERPAVSVFQDGKMAESYTPAILNDLPTPTEQFSDY